MSGRWNSGSSRDRYFRDWSAYQSGRVDKEPPVPPGVSAGQARAIRREAHLNAAGLRKMLRGTDGRIQAMLRGGFGRRKP